MSGTTELEPDGTEASLAPLDAHLKRRVGGLSGSMRLERIAGGQSNPTFFAHYDNRSLVVRAKPRGDLLPSAHAVDREYRVLRALEATPVPTPRALFYCDDPEVYPTPFYVMEKVPGRVFADAALAGCSPGFRRQAYLAMADGLADLHSQDWRALRLADFGRPEGYFRRQVRRWTERWRATQFRDMPDLDALANWLADDLPADSPLRSIVHGDYRVGNLLFSDAGRVNAILDWELSTIGHPFADVAHSCIWWRITPEEYGGLKGLDLDRLGIPSEREYLDHYYARVGAAEGLQSFHFAFAFFRLAVIFEGIAERARRGTASSDDAALVGDLSYRFARYGLEAVQS